MRILAVLALIMATDAHALGGVASFPPPGTLFRDSVGKTVSQFYGWKGVQIVASNRALAMGNGSPSRFPQSSIQWSTQPGDRPLPGVSTERAEGLFALAPSPGADVTAYGTTHYIAMSVYLPAGWQDSVAGTGYPSPWFFIEQLHADEEQINPPQAAWAINVIGGSLVMQQWGGKGTLGYSATHTYTTLGAEQIGAWVDIVAEVTFEPDNTGRTCVWTRTCPAGPTPGTCPGALQQQQISATNTGSPIACFNAPTAWEFDDGTMIPLYYKHGIYRNPQSFTQTYYSGPFVIASTFEDAAIAAFGQWP